MAYREEFPDFDDAESCVSLIGDGWEDVSWHNDTSPSFERSGVVIWVDYVDPSLREFPERYDRFAVMIRGNDALIGECATLAEALAIARQGSVEVIGERFASVLSGWLKHSQWEEMRRVNVGNVGDSVCASHDFCDANEAMSKAFMSVTGREISGDNEADCQLWNDAWSFAKRTQLTLST